MMMESCNTGNGGRNGFRGIGNEFPPRGRRGAVWVEKKEIPVYFLFTRIYDYEKISRNSGSSAEYDHVILYNAHVKQNSACMLQMASQYHFHSICSDFNASFFFPFLRLHFPRPIHSGLPIFSRSDGKCTGKRD